jgi:hypothetical protein
MPFTNVDHGPALVDALTRQRRMGGHARRGGEVPSLLVPQRPAHPQLVPRGDPRCLGTGHNKALGCQVRRGEHGIDVLAPVTYRAGGRCGPIVLAALEEAADARIERIEAASVPRLRDIVGAAL